MFKNESTRLVILPLTKGQSRVWGLFWWLCKRHCFRVWLIAKSPRQQTLLKNGLGWRLLAEIFLLNTGLQVFFHNAHIHMTVYCYCACTWHGTHWSQSTLKLFKTSAMMAHWKLTSKVYLFLDTLVMKTNKP